MKTHGNKHGMNWISQVKRLAIYLRDGLACAYCGQSVEQGAALCLDHIVSRCDGGTNDEGNLITACKRCNDSKNHRSLRSFARAVAAYINHGLSPTDITRHVRACVARPLAGFKTEAQRLINERGSASRVLATLR
jgi:5-methylcytosine-specific restriction endonuclease McrA